MDEEKYRKCKREIKIWETEFKKKNGRVPSKHDFREAEKSVREAYRLYCKMKTAMLEETLRDVLDEDMDSMMTVLDNSQLDDSINCAPFELPKTLPLLEQTVKVAVEDQPVKEFEANENMSVNQNVWGLELNKKPEKQKKVTEKVQLVQPKLKTKKSFSIRNPRKTFVKSDSSMSKHSSNSSINFSQGFDENLPDLETILLEKAKRNNTEDEQNIKSSKLSTLINTVDQNWLNRQDPHQKPSSLVASDSNTSRFGLQNIDIPTLLEPQSSFGMSNLKILSSKDLSGMIREERTVIPESDSDAVISNSEDELTVANIKDRLTCRHTSKRRRLLNANVVSTQNIDSSGKNTNFVIENTNSNTELSENNPQTRTIETDNLKSPSNIESVKRAKPANKTSTIRRSKRIKREEAPYVNESDSDQERDPFADDDDSDKDPTFNDKEDQVFDSKLGKSKSEIQVRSEIKPSKGSKLKEKAKRFIKNVKSIKKSNEPKTVKSNKKSHDVKVVKKTNKKKNSKDLPDDVESNKNLFNTSQEFNDYVLEFGIERTETVPRIDPNILKETTLKIEEFICSDPTASVVNPERESKASGMMVSQARAKLEKRIAAGNLNDNFVRLNMKKKVFVRGKKVFNFSRHKKSLWKKKKAAALAGPEMDMGGCDGGVLECFHCGGTGHMARQCKIKGDTLLPLDVAEDDVSPFPTLQEAEEMVRNQKHSVHASKPGNLPGAVNRNLIEPDAVLETDAEEENYESMNFGSDFEEDEPVVQVQRHIIPEDFLKLSGILEKNAEKDQIQPLYALTENGQIKPTPSEVHQALSLFGHTSFRKGQEKAIMRILSGQSTLVTLSTGSGKSLCYQLPAYIFKQHRNCITLVISPLVSLMEDQVHGIPSCLNAQCLHTNQTEKQRDKIMEMVRNNTLDILLVSPEAVVAGEKATGFGALLRQLPPIAFVCIDEAHCVSQWSHNFRPSYLMICRVLKEKLNVKTILGLTATATKSTRDSIINHLQIPDGEAGVIEDIPMPDNLFLTVSKDFHRDIALLELVKSERFAHCHSIIIYCTRREECERIAGFLRTGLQDTFVPPESSKRKRLNWIAEPYHAGMVASRRRSVQNAFMSGELRIVVATVAFGMGINKSNIRAVIHYNMPKSFESYVQEVGRAGRDGKRSECHVFLDGKGSDRNELRRHIYSNSIDRHVIRKLLQKVFVPCSCPKDESNLSSKRSCPGHEVCFSVEGIVQLLDIPEENIATLLCYLELHDQRYIQVLSRAYTMCKIFSYGGAKQLRVAAKTCPPLAMAIALDMKRGISHDTSTMIEFPVIDIAAAIGWDSGVVKYQLKQLEWNSVNGQSKRSTISVTFYDLGFRVRAPGNLSDDELDASLEFLHQRVMQQEKSELYQLQSTFDALQSVAFASYIPAASVACDVTSSNQLKTIIRNYFTKLVPQIIEIPDEPEVVPDELIINDIRTLIQRYPENNFTGRAIARIFYGVSSPNYPAVIWGRCKYWRMHMKANFNRIVLLANAEIIRKRL